MILDVSSNPDSSVILFWRDEIQKLVKSLQAFFGFVCLFLLKFISLTLGPDQLNHPIDRTVHSLWAVSVLNICSGLDAISHLNAPVMYMKPRLGNSLIHLLWTFMNCKAIKAQFSSLLSKLSCHRLQWEPGTSEEIWNWLRGCALGSMLILYNSKISLSHKSITVTINHTMFTIPRTSAPVIRKVHVSQMFSAFLSFNQLCLILAPEM